MKPNHPDNSKNGHRNQSPIAIVGMACIFPGAEDVKSYWSNIVKKVDAITDIPSTHWKPEDYFNDDPKLADHTYARKGGFISPVDFDPIEFGITPNTVEATDTSQLLGLVVARQALNDAGYGVDRDFNRENVSVVLGITGALELVIPLGARLGHPKWRKALRESGIDSEKSEEIVKRISDSYVGWQENSFPGLLGNVVAGRIANRLDFGGTNCVVDAACASSLSALHLSCMELDAGRSDMVIAGGLDTFNDIFMYMCFSKTPVLSPTGHARPFDHKEDGTVLGEGVGMLILKRLEDAKRDNDKIHALIKGVGSSSDGKGNAIYMPTSSGQARALKDAYKISGVSPDSIELVEAHGTGTKVGDAAEVNALSSVYSESGRKESWCALGSVKSQIGHTKAAAGIAGMIKAVMALQSKVLPPTLKVDKPIKEVLPGKTPFYINTESRPWIKTSETPRRAAVSAFGFGGSNFHCVLEEYKTEKEDVLWDPDIEIMAFSASDIRGLAEKLDRFSADLSWEDVRSAAPAIRAGFDASADCRISMVLNRNGKTLSQIVKSSLQMLERSPDKSGWSTPDNVFFQNGGGASGLGIIFPGQGSQYCGMMRDLACSFPQLHNALEKSDVALKKLSENRNNSVLADYIFPVSAFDETSRQKNETELRKTEVAQPAIGAVSLGVFRVLEYFGLSADSFGGHSFGELTALTASGRIAEEDFFMMAALRGELMGRQSGVEGAMLAVRAGSEYVEKIISEEGILLVVANRNTPTQVVLSGAVKEVEKAADIFLKKKVSHIRLPVSGAFHSPLVSGCRDSFFNSVRDVSLTHDLRPVYSNTTGGLYPENSDAALKLLSRQLAEPVEFISMIESMYGSGIRTFLEVGPGARLSRIVAEILGDRPFDSFSLDASNGKQGGLHDLAVTLCRLAVGGHALELLRWNDGILKSDAGKNKKKAMTIPVCGANYFRPASGKGRAAVVSVNGQNGGVRKISSTEKQEKMSLKQNLTETGSFQGETRTEKSRKNTSVYGNSYLKDALKATSESIFALQKMQEETARIHSRFLTGQTKTQEAMLSLIDRQQALFDTKGFSSENKLKEPLPQINPVSSSGHTNYVGEASTDDHNKVLSRSPSADKSVDRSENSNSQVSDVLFQVISEKTGYPQEMLEPDMTMDSDLGIDSIKQVEILSAISEKLPGSPEVRPDQMGTLRTLKDLASYLTESGGARITEKESVPDTGTNNLTITEQVLMEIVSEKTGYPQEMLEPDMTMDSDLGIDSIKQVEILSAVSEKLPESPEVRPDQMGELCTLKDLAAYLSPGDADNATIEKSDPGETDGDTISVSRVLMEIVSEKTGYPQEMLEPDMTMDSDLGIDSIKQVEILSAISERLPESPEVRPDQMGTLRTLRELGIFLGNGRMKNGSDRGGNLSSADDKEADTDGPLSGLERSVLFPEPLEPAEAREDYSVKKGSTIWILDDGSTLSGVVSKKLQAKGYNTALIEPGSSPDLPESLGGLLILSPAGNIPENYFRQVLEITQLAASGLKLSAENGSGASFVTVSRLDGSFGLNGLGAGMNPVTGGLSGFTKTISHEWPYINARAIDFTPVSSSEERAASVIADEMFKRGPLETGISKTGLTKLLLKKTPLPESGECGVLGRDDVVLITGGARGVTAEVAVKIAETYKCRVILVGRTILRDEEPVWLRGVAGERDIKKAIMENSNGNKPTPKYIGDTYRNISASREIERNTGRIRDAGGDAHYISADVADPSGFAKVVADIETRFGSVTGVIHGAGVLFDRRIEDKTAEQFEAVFRTKVFGINTILSSIDTDALKVLVLFSSSTGRYGRTGQLDYAVANEVLNKIAQKQARLLKKCRVLSLNWGPWDGGMVTPGLKKIFEKEGVGVIGLSAGAGYLVREIEAGSSGDVEIVVLGEKSMDGTLPVSAGAGKIISSLPEAGMKRAISYDLTQDRFRFLASHIINGKPVLPMAVMIEWCAQAALHSNPGLHFAGFSNFGILKGVVIEQGAGCSIEILTGSAVRHGDSFLLPVEIRGTGSGNTGILHARGEFILSLSGLPKTRRVDIDTDIRTSYNNSAIYSEHLFHGEALQGIDRVEVCDTQAVQALVKSAPPPSEWIKNPERGTWITDPLVVDSAFQLMILWTIDRYDMESLPCSIGRYTQYQSRFPKDGVRLRAEIIRSNDKFARSDISFYDSKNFLVAKIEEYECALNRSLRKAFHHA